MQKVFLDTNVLLDFLLNREPFHFDIAEIIQNSINESFKICVSPITITDINYIIARSEGTKAAKKKIKKILELVKIENVGESTIHKSINSKFKDFEDGVQNYCALQANHDVIITRNVKDFKESELSIMTPKEFLGKLKTETKK